MPSWTHLIRFEAVEDGYVHLGQLVDTTRDFGLDTVDGISIQAFRINGDIYNGTVTNQKLTVHKASLLVILSRTSNDLNNPQLLAPISQSQCNYIRCLGLNYTDHAKEAKMQLPKAPILFTKPCTALANPYPSATVIPKCAQDGTSDYEAELCVVVGRTVETSKSPKLLITFLATQLPTMFRRGRCSFSRRSGAYPKAWMRAVPLVGYMLASSVPAPGADNTYRSCSGRAQHHQQSSELAYRAVYNGQTVQDGNTRDIVFTIREQIAYFSKGTTLQAGSLILTGTPAGIGYFREPQVVLRDGDDIRIHIGGIGTLINKVLYDVM
ncbi:hypothetical protein LTR17_014478 [Elasticomyces elasticus]|nr:hypothetical protein LTR17_014478 [Elasticomyces elasticus]